MKFTLSWLQEHLETGADATAIAERLTGLGLEVEGIEDRAAALRPFTIAQVVAVERHPQADKLNVCTVDLGQGERVQVVCGAPNVRLGMKGVFGRPGTVVPGLGIELKTVSIRGVESQGMLCSERELQLSDSHEGIIDLPADAPLGASFATLRGLDDPVFEIGLTPNRQDCLGVRGIARDLAAAGLGTLKPLPADPVPGRFASPLDVRLDLPAGQEAACPLFVGRYIRNLRNGPSPQWLQRRLQAIGLRPISALVDITNLMTIDLARPLHVFDADRLNGDIHVRLGRPGERLAALDGHDYELDGEICAICDESGVLSLGGIMGGEASGVTAETVNVFIESALFDPVRTAMAGRRLGIASDARYRFERGVDPTSARPGIEIATRLVLELCGGEPAEVVVAGTEPDWRRSIDFRPERVRSLGGLEVAAPEQARILRALGFGVEGEPPRLTVAVPPWRGDIDGEADLIEEVARVHGYDAIPSVPLPVARTVPEPSLSPSQRRVRTARRLLAGRGLMEAVTYSFIASQHARLFGGGDAALILANPISAELDALRPSVLPALVAAAGRNIARGLADLALFEVGPQYRDATPGGQSMVAAGIRRGRTGPRHWLEAPREVDAFDAKADALALLAAAGLPAETLPVAAEAPDWYHPGRSGSMRLGQSVVATFGELHPMVLESMDVKGPLVGFEVHLDRLPLPRRAGTARPRLAVSDLPAVERDFAFLVDAEVAAERLMRAARSADRDLIGQVSVFDVYQGAGLGEGRKSVALTVRLEPKEKTLTEPEIEAVAAKIVAAVAKATGGTLRG